MIIAAQRLASLAVSHSQTKPYSMAGGINRTRSNTSGSTASNRPRPVSRASTTSANTAVEQSIEQPRHVSESSHMQPAPSSHNYTSHYTPEEMITHSRQQLTNPHHEYAIDPSLHDHISHARAMNVGNQYTGHNDAHGEPTLHFDPFGGKEDQTFMSNGEQTPDDPAGVDSKKKKGSASSIANDLELRRLFKENKHRDLKDVATSVLAEERGPRSEKTKQIFAMNW